MRIIPTRIHGVLDYLVGAILIAAPWLFHFNYGGAETWVPVVLGAAAIGYSLATDYELGVLRLIPMSTHLMLDMASGVVLLVSPWLFGFHDRIWLPHVIVGLIEIVTPLMTQRVPTDLYASRAGRTTRTRPSGAHG